MKPNSFANLLFLSSLLVSTLSFSQGPSSYKLPDNFHFDYEVTQVLVNKKSMRDSCVAHFFYTKNGDYAAVRMDQKSNKREKLLIVLTRDGDGVIFDEQKMNITVISVRKLLSDFSGLAKWVRMDSVMAHLRQKTDDKHFHSVKTGKTRQFGNYSAEEYSVSDGNNHTTSVWFTKVDFNTPGDYILGSGIGNVIKMMGNQLAAHPLFLALTQPHTMVTEINGGDSPGAFGMDLKTESINQIQTTIPTSGYQVNDYSNMTLMEIFQAGMKKKNN